MHNTNIVYAIFCRKCGQIYIGQTSQILGDRMAQHLRSVREDDGKPVARHFNSAGHRISDFTFTGLATCHSTERYRRGVEIRMILKLGTLSPNGMNSRSDVQLS